MTPDKRKTPEGTGADATTYSITSPNCNSASTTTTSSSGFGVLADRPITTTRRCEGWGCWCHVGAGSSWPFDHFDELARMTREIRALEISEGVLGI
jgi:hypothetical protein